MIELQDRTLSVFNIYDSSIMSKLEVRILFEKDRILFGMDRIHFVQDSIVYVKVRIFYAETVYF